ncbi:DUF2201 family putative metallopeptidase [Ferrimicrobium acidiphilum]|uniref:DUF2201 family putative metallopeptidase n=1 Tax=Ferrimicrobium acidiphilum TaxID=121039 RepID=UPI0023F318A6|nr:VWA-like domain-containing protein [Ferrimicrobium acidiphilum]
MSERRPLDRQAPTTAPPSSAIQQKLAHARERASQVYPPYGYLLKSLQVVFDKRVPTAAVDTHMRVYWNPNFVNSTPVEELVGVYLHEASHVVRSHANRRGTLNPQTWNILTDMETNDDLVAEQIPLPKGAMQPEMFDLPAGKSAETYWQLLKNRYGDNAEQEIQNTYDEIQEQVKQEQQPQPGDSQSQSSPGNAGDDPSDGTDPAQPKGSGEQQPQPGDSQSQSSPGNAGDDPSDGTDPEGDISEGQWSPDSDFEDGHQEINCGSAADGYERPWELPYGDPDAPGLNDAEKQKIHQQVERAFREYYEKGRTFGYQEGREDTQVERTALKGLNLREISRKAMQTAVSGARRSTPTYNKINRRYQAPVIMPVQRKHGFSVALIVDTSGSMTKTEIGMALTVADRLIRDCGVQKSEIRLMAVDTAIHEVKQLSDMQRLWVRGGGGTDMQAGIDAAVLLRPKPSLIVVVTDADSAWSATPPPVPVIVCATAKGHPAIPKWATTIPLWALRTNTPTNASTSPYSWTSAALAGGTEASTINGGSFS